MPRLQAPLLALALLTLLPGAQGRSSRAAQPPEPAPKGQPALADLHGDLLPPGAVARLGGVRLLHPGGATALAYAPDGKTLATGGPDRTVRLWDVRTGRPLRRLAGHKDEVCALAFLPDGKTLASGSKDGSILLWDVATGDKRRGVFHLRQPLQELSISSVPLPRADGETPGWLMVSAGGGSLALWEVPAGRFLRPVSFEQLGGLHALFSPDGKAMVTAGWSDSIAVNDTATGKQIRIFRVPGKSDAALVRAVFAGKALVGADTRGKVHVYDAATAEVRYSVKGGFYSRAACLAASPDGKLLACGGDGTNASLWVYDLTTGREHWHASDPVTPAALAFSPDGKTLAATGTDGAIRLWHADSDRPLGRRPGHDGPVVRLSLSEDGKTIVTAGADGVLHFWDRASGKERRPPSAGWGLLSALALTPDGKALVAGGASLPCLLDLTRDAESRRDALRKGFLKELPDARWITLSPDGSLYATYPNAQIVVRERVGDREVARLGRAIPYSSAVFSPDNKLLAVVFGERDAHVLEVRTNRLMMQSTEGAAEVRRALAFSPDSKLLASASDKRGVELWDLARKTRTRFPREKQAPSTTVAFSADGKLLAWDTPDGAVCVGDVATATERLRLRGHEAPITGVAFTPNGRFLVSASRDGTALVWDLPGLLRHGQGAPGAIAQGAPKPAAPRTDVYGDRLPQDAQARMGAARWLLEGRTQAIALTPDGKGLLVQPEGKPAGGLRILAVPSGKQVWSIPGAKDRYAVYPGGPVTHGNVMAIPHGPRLDLWDMATRRLLRQIEVDKHYPSVVAISPDGKVLATGLRTFDKGKNTPIRLWDVATGQALGFLEGNPTSIQTLMFTADGKRLLSASGEARFDLGNKRIEVIPGWVRVWDLATHTQIAQYPNESHGLIFAPGGHTWAYQGRDNRIHLAETAGGKEVAQFELQGSTFAFTPDGKELATAGFGQAIQFRDAATGKVQRRLEGQLGRHYNTLLFAPDGKTLACASQFTWSMSGGKVRLWDLTTGKEIHPYPAHQGPADCVAYAPDGKTVASGGKDGSLFLWDAASGKSRHRLGEHSGGVTVVAFAHDGRVLASGGEDGMVRLWDVAGGKLLRQLEGSDAIVALTFAADGKSLWTCGAKGKVQGWEVPGGRGLAGFECRAPQSLHNAAFSSDGSLLAYVPGFRREFSATSTVHVCRVPSGKELLTLELRPQLAGDEAARFEGLHCWAVAFSADGRLLATSESVQTQGLRLILNNHTVQIWELATGKQVQKLTGLGLPTRRLAFSPDGRLLAHGQGQGHRFGQGDETVILLRDLSAGEDLQQVITDKGDVMCQHSGVKLRPLGGHAGGVACVTFAPDGKTLVTGGGDGTLLTWTAAAFVPGAPPRSAKVTAKDVELCWERLAGDAGLAYKALGRLEAVPDLAVRLLKERLKPVPAADLKRVAQLLVNLEDRNFSVRLKAFNELALYAEQAEEALRQALPKQRSLEAQRRIQQLLDRLDKVGLAPEFVRTLRALTLLERIGTPEARRVIEGLAAGPPTRLTRAARISLERRFGQVRGGE